MVVLVEELSADSAELPKVLVFVERRRSADYLGAYLNESGFDALTLHGHRDQAQREESLRYFNTGQVSVGSVGSELLTCSFTSGANPCDDGLRRARPRHQGRRHRPQLRPPTGPLTSSEGG